MFLQTLATRGMPSRGSVQDRLVCEMLVRQRKKHLSTNIYLARILAAGLNLPEKIFRLWTELLALEIHHENYSPSVVKAKREVIKTLDEVTKPNSPERMRMFSKLQNLEVRDEDMRPPTPQEVEAYKRKLRARRLRAAQQR